MAKRGQCVVCCGLLVGDRRARYCSDACKMRAYRKRVKGKKSVRAGGGPRLGSKRTRAAALRGRHAAR